MNRKHYLNLTAEQKERIFERDLADRLRSEKMTKRNRRFCEALLNDSNKKEIK